MGHHRPLVGGPGSLCLVNQGKVERLGGNGVDKRDGSSRFTPVLSARRPVPADDEKQFASMARTDFGRWQIVMNMSVSSGLEANLAG